MANGQTVNNTASKAENQPNDDTKTHWLRSPNKNYLGACDLPNGKDVVLTIASAGEENVENCKSFGSKKTHSSATKTEVSFQEVERKKVIRFEEKYDWVKPFICNQINAQTIMKVTGERYMEDCIGKAIKLYSGRTKVKGEEIDCLRVRLEMSKNLQNVETVSEEDVKFLTHIIKSANVTAQQFCTAYEIETISELPKSKLQNALKRIEERAKKNENS